MRFPAGTDGGILASPRSGDFARDLPSFTGIIEIETGTGRGFILARNRTLISAYFRSEDTEYRGKEALSRMTPGAAGLNDPSISLRIYDPGDFSRALALSQDEHLLLEENGSRSSRPEYGNAGTPRLLDEARLKKILNQPGVIAVSAFFEGFPVQSLGNADFEHIAASAEDFTRAGMKIAREMGIGEPGQLILETESHKLIIAPCADLSLCIVTTSDVQLGLIRVVLRSIQQEIAC